MQAAAQMDFPKSNALSKEDCEAIVRNLDACIAILDKNAGRRSITQIQTRSMIAVLRSEIAKEASGETIFPPFAF